MQCVWCEGKGKVTWLPSKDKTCPRCNGRGHHADPLTSPSPTPDPMERIAAALEAIAASLDKIQREGLTVERVP